jgi:hypothetical protein
MRHSPSGTSKRNHRAVAMVFAATSVAFAQQPGPTREAVQGRIAAVKEAAAANQAALRQYTWKENLEFSIKGEDRTNRTFYCRYGSDGNISRVPIGPPPDSTKERPLRQRIENEAKEDAEGFMRRAWTVIGLYVPPDGQKMEQAFQAGKATVNRAADGEGGLSFKDYAKPGDSMVLDFNMTTKKLASMNVNSFLDDPSQPISLAITFGTLPDGTNYPAKIVLNAPPKGIQVTMANTDYKKSGS